VSLGDWRRVTFNSINMTRIIKIKTITGTSRVAVSNIRNWQASKITPVETLQVAVAESGKKSVREIAAWSITGVVAVIALAYLTYTLTVLNPF